MYNSTDQTTARYYAPTDASPSISFGKNVLGPSSANYAPGGDGNLGYGGTDQNDEELDGKAELLDLLHDLKSRYVTEEAQHIIALIEHAVEKYIE